MGCVAPVYRPRDAEHTVLHQVVARRLEAFLEAVAEARRRSGPAAYAELGISGIMPSPGLCRVGPVPCSVPDVTGQSEG